MNPHTKPKQKTEKADLEKLSKELAEMTELAKRQVADMQNLRRRTEEERTQIFAMASGELIKKILPVVDNLDRAATHVPDSAKDWFKGIELSLTELHKIFTDFGLQKMQTLNQPFDPNLHEAVLQGQGPKDTVIEELEAGYTLNGKVLRHAKVKVGT